MSFFLFSLLLLSNPPFFCTDVPTFSGKRVRPRTQEVSLNFLSQALSLIFGPRSVQVQVSLRRESGSMTTTHRGESEELSRFLEKKRNCPLRPIWSERLGLVIIFGKLVNQFGVELLWGEFWRNSCCCCFLRRVDILWFTGN